MWLAALGVSAVIAISVAVAVPATNVPVPAPASVPTGHSDGLSDQHGGYRLEPVSLPQERGDAVPVAFRILGPDGAPATGYADVATMPLHLYAVREDLTGYQHLHPRLVGDTWRTALRVPDGGVYRLYAEFTPAHLVAYGQPIVLGTRFIITADTNQVTLPAASATTTVDRFTVNRLDGMPTLPSGVATVLRFQVLDAGGPVASLEPYLGTFAHLSGFDVPTQALTHVHPAMAPNAAAPRDGTLAFHTVFHHPGPQRLFLQFQVAGTVHLAAFTVVVS